MAQESTIGKLSSDQLRILVDVWPGLEMLVGDVSARIRADPDRLLPLAGPRFHWAHLYEMPFEIHLQKVVVALGLAHQFAGMVKDGARTGDFIEMMPGLLKSEDGELAIPPEPANVAWVLALATSVIKSFECVLTFGVYVNQLVERARQGDDRALLDAIRIDRSVLGGITGTARLSMAILRGETAFQNSVVSAWAQKVGVGRAANYRKMRLVLRVLVDSGAGRLGDAQLEALFVDALRLYAPGPGTRKNLRKFVDRYVKEMSTS